MTKKIEKKRRKRNDDLDKKCRQKEKKNYKKKEKIWLETIRVSKKNDKK